MKTAYGFTRFDTLAEFKSWLGKQNPTRKIKLLQVHHTGLPDYPCFYKSNGTHEDELTRQKNMKDYHVNTNGWSTIAQHFTIFPNGRIVTGRSLNSNPSGITGANTGAICIEIYGNFDKGKDIMKAEQKEAVIAVYAELCKKFNLTPSINTIRYHAWYTSSGTYLGTYIAGKSRKTCPGTNFFGGNTKEAFEKNFIPMIKDYIANNKVTITTPTQPSTQPSTPGSSKSYVAGVYKIDTDTLNVRKEANSSSAIVTTVKRGESYTITEVKDGWGKLKSGVGWISLSYCQLVKATEVAFKQYIVRVTASTLNGRKEASTSSAIVQTVAKGVAVTIIEEKTNGDTKWGKTKSGYWISLAYTEFVRYV